MQNILSKNKIFDTGFFPGFCNQLSNSVWAVKHLIRLWLQEGKLAKEATYLLKWNHKTIDYFPATVVFCFQIYLGPNIYCYKQK